MLAVLLIARHKTTLTVDTLGVHDARETIKPPAEIGDLEKAMYVALPVACRDAECAVDACAVFGDWKMVETQRIDGTQPLLEREHLVDVVPHA
jgi:hypothetical protein